MEARDPIPPAGGRAIGLARKLLQERACVADCRNIRHAVQAGLLAAAIGGDQRGRAAHMVAVVQAEIAGHPGQDHAIGLLQGLAALMPELKRMGWAQQPPRHSGEIDGQAKLGRCGCNAGWIVPRRERLAAYDGKGPRRTRKCLGRR